MENQRKIQQLDEKLEAVLAQQPWTDGGRPMPVVPACSDCGRDGVPGTHKQKYCIKCPGCGAILYRLMEVSG
jgi:ribosomal protein S27E